MSRGKFLILLLVEFIAVMGALFYLYSDAFGNEEPNTWSDNVWQMRDHMCVEVVPDTNNTMIFFFPCFIRNDPMKKKMWEELCWEDTDLYLNETCYGYML